MRRNARQRRRDETRAVGWLVASRDAPPRRARENRLIRSPYLICPVLVFVVITIIVHSGVLVLLVLGHQIVHVRFSLSELHLVHTLTRVPVQESLATEHRRERFADALEHLLNRGSVTDKGGGHLKTLGRDVAHRALHVVRNPLHEVRRIFVLNIQELFVNFLG